MLTDTFKSKWCNLAISILIPLIVGSTASLCSKAGMNTFEQISKPAITPPNYIFPIVWTILYILMGISSFLIYNSSAKSQEKFFALSVYAIHLLFNFFWTILFFNLQAYFLAFLWIILLILLISIMIFTFYHISKKAAYLQIPYLIWTIFATVLNFLVYKMNS